MKRTVYLLLSVALITAFCSCTPSEPDLKRTDYLKLVYNTVGMPVEKANKTLTRKGFIDTNQSLKDNGVQAAMSDKTYKFQSKDSTVVLTLGLATKNDTVKQFTLEAQLEGEEHAQEVQKLYSDWSTYGYNTIFSEISIWTGIFMDLDNEEGKLYIDGGLATSIKNMISLYYATGEMDEETYQYIIQAFERKRGDFEGDMGSSDFLRQDRASAIETYAHLTGALDITALANSLRDIKANAGALIGIKNESEQGYPHWNITFTFMGEQDLSKVMESLPL